MNSDWTQADSSLRCITVTGSENNEMVEVSGTAEGLECVGIGTDAAVFTYDLTPGYAFKVYSELALTKKETEKLVYEKLAGLPFFPQCYGSGDHYLVLSYEPGDTLHDCLIQGIPIPEQVIMDVETACEQARSCGLNPRDIHLKNVIMQDGRGKVLDVSEYVKEGNDKRWEHLVWAYHTFYPSIEGKKIPAWVLESIRRGYSRLDQANVNLDDFAARVNQLFSKFYK
jgi:hypothetical protein